MLLKAHYGNGANSVLSRYSLRIYELNASLAWTMPASIERMLNTLSVVMYTIPAHYPQRDIAQ